MKTFVLAMKWFLIGNRTHYHWSAMLKYDGLHSMLWWQRPSTGSKSLMTILLISVCINIYHKIKVALRLDWLIEPYNTYLVDHSLSEKQIYEKNTSKYYLKYINKSWLNGSFTWITKAENHALSYLQTWIGSQTQNCIQ